MTGLLAAIFSLIVLPLRAFANEDISAVTIDFTSIYAIMGIVITASLVCLGLIYAIRIFRG